MPVIMHNEEINHLLDDAVRLHRYDVSVADFNNSNCDLSVSKILRFIDKYSNKSTSKMEELCFGILNKFALNISSKLLLGILKLTPAIINFFNFEGNSLLMKMCVDSSIREYTTERILIAKILIQYGADSKILSHNQKLESAISKFIKNVKIKSLVLGDIDDKNDPVVKVAYDQLLTFVPVFVLFVKKHNSSELKEILELLATENSSGYGEEYYDKLLNQFYNAVKELEKARLQMLAFSFNIKREGMAKATNEALLDQDHNGYIRRRIFNYLC